MMPRREHADYLNDIMDAIEKIGQFISGMNYEEFSRDDKTVYATIRALEIIGEAAKKIPNEVRDTYPDIPWREMTGMRDKLSHDYIGINLEVVWKTVSEDVVQLQSMK